MKKIIQIIFILTIFNNSSIAQISGVAVGPLTNGATPQSTYLGANAGNAATGGNNTFIGFQSGQNSVGGVNGGVNTFVGYQTGMNSSGYWSSFYGDKAGFGSNGANNNFFGQRNGLNVIGNNNCSFGNLPAPTSTRTNSFNCTFGTYSGAMLNADPLLPNSANLNSFFGEFSGNSTSTGQRNVFIGRAAGINNTTGSFNTYVGENSGSMNTTGTNNISIGRESRLGGANNNTIAIGAFSNIAQDNSMLLGAIQYSAIYPGNQYMRVGINTSTPGNSALGQGFGAQLHVAPSADPAELDAIWTATGATHSRIRFQSLPVLNLNATTQPLFRVVVTNPETGKLYTTQLNVGGIPGPQGPAGTNGMNGTNGTNGVDGEDGNDALIVTTPEGAGSHCPNGGIKIETGTDDNGDGTLDVGEITSTNYVCNGEDGAGGTGGDDEDWHITGNDDIDQSINFLGTKINQDIIFKRNNIRAGWLNSIKYNTSFGVLAMDPSNLGVFNTAIGFEALSNIHTDPLKNSWANTGIGAKALKNLTHGARNTALGNSALVSITQSSDNTAIGDASNGNSVLGSYNTSVGSSSLVNNNGGLDNSAFGFYALAQNESGYFNTAIGSNASNFEIPNGHPGHPLGGLVNTTTLGYNAQVDVSNTVRIGNAAVESVISELGMWPSDSRFKTNVQKNVPGLNFITQLRPVTYNFEKQLYSLHIGEQQDSVYVQILANQDAANKLRTGFIAQEVESLIDSLGYDFDGIHRPENTHDAYALSYASFVVPLVKAVQELDSVDKFNKEKIDSLESRLDAVENCCNSPEARVVNNNQQVTILQKQIDELKAIIATMTKDVDKCCTKIGNNPIQDFPINQDIKLYQNIPNPFSKETEIKFFIPETVKQAFLHIYDLQGKQIRVIEINNRSESSVRINGKELAAGMYMYSLIADGREMDTKRMILTDY